MKIIKKIVSRIKEDAFTRILTELTIGTLLFNLSNMFGIFFVIIIAIELLFANEKNCIYIYIYISFFDEVLQSKYLSGSISRIFMVIIAIKLIFNIIKQRIKPNRRELGILLFFAFSFIIGLITYRSVSTEVIIIMFNIFIFVLFSMNIKIKSKKEQDIFIENLLFVIVIAVLNCIFYGLLNNSFLKEIDGNNIVYRFKGTYEPNFMSLFINLGIIALLSIKGKKIDKKMSYVLCAIMVNANIMTVSITGIISFVITLFLYFILNKKNIKEELKDIGIIAIVTIVFFAGLQTYRNVLNDRNDIKANDVQENISKSSIEKNEEENLNVRVPQKTGKEVIKEKSKSDFMKRFEFLQELLKKGDFNRITSGRLALLETFSKASFNRPLINILFGNDATTKKIFSDYFGGEKYSHNSYIDILYNFGIIGFIILIVYVIYVTVKNKYLKLDLKCSYYGNSIKLIRIMLLIFAFSLSFYTKRMILVFFLL